MGAKTAIEWCDATWSPWEGCTGGGVRIVAAADTSGITLAERRYAITSAHGLDFVRVGKAAAGRMLDGRTHDAFPAPYGASEYAPGRR